MAMAKSPSKKGSNRPLNKAIQVKNDEFYTQLTDIENELKHYKDQFRGKGVYCNCDDPYESNFFKYFAANFKELGLKKLITTSYVKSPIVGGQLPLFEVKGLKPKGKEPFKIEINKVSDTNADGSVGLADVKWLLKNDANVATPLKSSGDFRSEECVELLKEADIVVTNPPFSLFREYISQLIKFKKKFLIIGNKNAITYKDVFKHVKDNKIWLGYRNINSDMWLMVPEGEKYEKVVDGVKLKHIMACWYTNLDTAKRHEKFTMYKKYAPKEYPKYNNYDAINVDVVAEIPKDYAGVMGVPITFLDKYNPDQFELLGSNRDVDQDPKGVYGKSSMLNGKETFKRLFIRNKKIEK